jgi:hypothetical protein
MSCARLEVDSAVNLGKHLRLRWPVKTLLLPAIPGREEDRVGTSVLPSL